MNLNKVIIAGRVSQAPQLRMTPGGQPVATMGVATNRQWKDKVGVAQEAVEFHAVVMWGKTAETASAYLDKGSLVLVEGRIATRSWNDKDGVTRRATEIIAENVQFGPRPGVPSGTPTTAKPPAPAKRSISNDEEEGEGRRLTPSFGEDEEEEEEEIDPADIPL